MTVGLELERLCTQAQAEAKVRLCLATHPRCGSSRSWHIARSDGGKQYADLMQQASKPVLGVPVVEILWATLMAIGFAVAIVVFIGPSANDDVYITFSAARAFAEFGLFSNLNGDPIEQSTSLLQTLMLTPVAAVVSPEHLPLAGWAMSIGFYVLAVVAGFMLLRQTLSARMAFAGAFMIALVPSLHYWSSSGMETSMTLFLVLLVMLWAQLLANGGWPEHPRGWTSSLKSAGLGAVLVLLLYASRPDAGLFVSFGIVLFFGFVSRRRRRVDRAVWLWAVLSPALVLALTAVRLMVTGSPLPQSVRAKSGRLITNLVGDGWGYVTDSFGDYWFPIAVGLVLVLLLLAARETADDRWLLASCMAVAAFLGVLASGGDWMPFGRFLVVLQVAVVILLVQLIAGLVRPQKALILSVVAVAMAFLSLEATRAGLGSPIYDRYVLASEQGLVRWSGADVRFNRWNWVHHRDLVFLDEAVPVIKGLLEEEDVVTIGSPQAGMVMYYLKAQFGDRIRFTDRWSLTTDDVTCEGLDRTANGKRLTWEQWVATAGGCSPQLPDVMFDIRKFPEELADEYTPVVEIDATLKNSSSGRGDISQWLAIRSDLL